MALLKLDRNVLLVLGQPLTQLHEASWSLRYGSVDVALVWPLRYSHSPEEVIDTKGLDDLSKIVEVLARKW